MTNILLIAGRYQLGNNAGFSRTPTMLATAWNFPFERPGSIRMPKRSDSFSTPPMWKHGGDWKGYRVAINGQEIGRLKDPSDTYGPAEVFTIKVPTATLEKILSGKDNFVLSVELERQPTQPGLSDKLVLTRIETDGTLAASLGSK